MSAREEAKRRAWLRAELVAAIARSREGARPASQDAHTSTALQVLGAMSHLAGLASEDVAKLIRGARRSTEEIDATIAHGCTCSAAELGGQHAPSCPLRGAEG